MDFSYNLGEMSSKKASLKNGEEPEVRIPNETFFCVALIPFIYMACWYLKRWETMTIFYIPLQH